MNEKDQASGANWGLRKHALVLGATVVLGTSVVGWRAVASHTGKATAQRAQEGKTPLERLMCHELDSIRVSDVGPKPNVIQEWKEECRRRAASINQLSNAAVPLIKVHFMIPEYNDEQRLRSGPADSLRKQVLGPVAGFYAAPQLAGYTSINQIDAQGKSGALIGYLVVDTTATATLVDSYRKLNIHAGVNCVWLAHDPASSDDHGWTGYVTAATTSDTTCVKPIATTPSLEVHRTRHGGPDLTAYPPAVRFEEGILRVPSPSGSVTAVQPLLGVKCLAGWCAMGPPGFGDGNPIRASDLAPLRGTDPEVLVSGWRDDQWLSILDNGVLRPSIRAVITPVHNVAALSREFSQSTHVATIHLFGNPPAGSKYQRWGLRNGANYLTLRRTGTQWVAWLKWPSRPDSIQWIVQRSDPHDEAVPGTARFRWMESDDAFWIACDNACCRSQGQS